MKSLYIGYFKPSEANFKEMWQSSLIVFDTNVLLHLYRYSEETREQLLTIIGTFKDRIWIPRKVADEFFDNRLEVLGKQIQEHFEVNLSWSLGGRDRLAGVSLLDIAIRYYRIISFVVK